MKKNLYNTLTAREAKVKLSQETIVRTTLSFYKFYSIIDTIETRNQLYLDLSNMSVLGRIYVATEGINAQISVPSDRFDELKSYLYSKLEKVRLNIALNTDDSFLILKIKVRNKLVADGIDIDYSNKNKKHDNYVNAELFNNLIDEKSLVVDMRNHYEYEIGHFQNAIEIPAETFREQMILLIDILKNKKNEKIALYCTGGIRCEKASDWMMYNGFKSVVQLEGGIINYVNTTKERNLQNKFIGKNFVFDTRLGESIGKPISLCHQCKKTSDTYTNCAYSPCHLLFIQCSECINTFDGCCSILCRNKLNEKN